MNVAAIIPKKTEVPMAIWLDAPAPVAIIIGNTPRIKVNAVIKTARNLSPAPFFDASRIDAPSSR